MYGYGRFGIGLFFVIDVDFLILWVRVGIMSRCVIL
jgi:hypothetical protein